MYEQFGSAFVLISKLFSRIHLRSGHNFVLILGRVYTWLHLFEAAAGFRLKHYSRASCSKGLH